MKTRFFHTFSVPELPNRYLAVRPEKEDDLVLMALARMLSLPFLSAAIFVDQSFAFRKDHRAFYSTVVGRGREALSIRSILIETASHASS